jgi:IclR family acetate operon transcriptional repressor
LRSLEKVSRLVRKDTLVKIDESQSSRDRGGRPPVQSLARGLAILSQFNGGDPSLTLAEVSRRTGLHKATVFRFLKTLEMEGYLIYDPQSGLYSIGPAWAVTLYDLGSATVFAELLNIDLRALAESSRETVTLGVRQGDSVHVVHLSPTCRGFIPKMPATRLHPLNSMWNVHAQIFLAYSSEAARRRALAVQPARFTEHTLVDREAALKRLDGVLEEGVAYEREEHDTGTCAVGVPIMLRGRVIAAIALIVPVERFTEDVVRSFVEQLRAAAKDIEQRLDVQQRPARGSAGTK